MTSRVDCSNELALLPYKDGVALLPLKQHDGNFVCCLADLMKFKINIFIHNLESKTAFINERCIKTYGIDSVKDIYFKSMHAISSPAQAEKLILHDRQVLKKQQTIIVHEDFCRKKDKCFMNAYSFKIPLYQNNHLVGIFGAAIYSEQDYTFSEGLREFFSLGLYKRHLPEITNDDAKTTFTRREQQCLRLLKQGFTAKMIATKLTLSFRTVELYLSNIKTKVGVNKKSELINLLYQDC